MAIIGSIAMVTSMITFLIIGIKAKDNDDVTFPALVAIGSLIIGAVFLVAAA